ncbi:MAG: calcium/proton exchanger [Clostridium butyricum]|nr:calcium/proton exchanger [Clostridium butyricum]
MKILKFLLIFVPISIVAKLMNVSPTMMFILASLSIIPLAGLMGEGTEEISFYTGPKMGGFLNATFGNATELIISFFALKAGLFEVVKFSITGSLIGNILLVLGLSMLIGGLKHKTQKFNGQVANITSSMLLFSVIGVCVPALFTHTLSPELLNTKYEGLSIAISIIMFLLYLLSLIFSFFTHKHLYSTNAESKESSKNAKWSLKKAISILVTATILIAIESEFLVGGIEDITTTIGLSEYFVGIVLIPVIGNAAEHSTAITMAIKNKMDVAIEIALGSSLQIILFVTPILIFLSLLFTPMSIIFNEFELIALLVSVLIADKVASDCESNWLEGAQLVAVYIIIAIGFFIL